MRRRRFMQTIGASGAAAGLSGCLGDDAPSIDPEADQNSGTANPSQADGDAVALEDSVLVERKLRVVFGHEIGLRQALDGQTVMGMAHEARSNREWASARDNFWMAAGFYHAADHAYERSHEEALELELFAAEGLLAEGRDHSRLMANAAELYAQTYELVLAGETSEASELLDDGNDEESDAKRYHLSSVAALRERLDLPAQ